MVLIYPVLACIILVCLVIIFIPALYHFVFNELDIILWDIYFFSRLERWGFVFMAAVAFFMDTTRRPGYEFLYWQNRALLVDLVYPLYYVLPWIIIAVRLFTVAVSFYLSRRFYADFTWEPSKAVVDGVISWCGVHADSKIKFSQVRKPVKIISYLFDSEEYRCRVRNRPVKDDMGMKEVLDDYIYKQIYS